MKTKILVIGALLWLLPAGAWAQPRFSLPAMVMAGRPAQAAVPGALPGAPLDQQSIDAVAVDGHRILVRQQHPLSPFADYRELVAGLEGRFSVSTPALDPGAAVQWGRRTALGDVDGDGIVDRVVAHTGGYTVTLELGDGEGGFAEAVAVVVGMGPVCVVIADVDGDGRADLVTGNRDAGTVAIVRQLAPGGTTLDAEIAAATARLAEAHGRVASLTDTRNGLGVTQQQLAADLQHVNAQVAQGETSVHAAEANVGGVQSELAALASTVAQLQQQLADETRALAQLPAAIAGLESGNTARRVDIAAAKTSHAALDAQIAALDAEARRLTRQNGRLAVSNTELQRRVSHAVTVNSQLAAALSEIRPQITAATAESSVVVEQAAQTQQETRRQRDAINQLEAQRREREERPR